MPIRLKRAGLNVAPNTGTIEGGPEFVEVPFENRVTEMDGQSFHWAHNQMRSMPDDGVAVGHASFTGGATIIEDSFPGEARS